MDPTQMPQMPVAMPSRGAQPQMPAGSDKMPKMASPEERQQLLDMIAQMKEKMGNFNAVSFASDNQSEQQRMDILKEVFSQLAAAGVDLTDPQSVNNFIEQLRIKNPEIAQMFEEALDALLGKEEIDTGEIPQGAPLPESPSAPIPPTGGAPGLG